MTCSYPGCVKEAVARKMCNGHYRRWWREVGGSPVADVRSRFWAKVDKEGPVSDYRPDLGPCWLWTGALTGGGYGCFRKDGRAQRSHRVAYEMLVGSIPEAMSLDHLCRVTDCCRPSHLEPVSHAENMRRSKWAWNGVSGTCPHGHIRNEENCYVAPGSGRKSCLPCRKNTVEMRGKK